MWTLALIYVIGFLSLTPVLCSPVDQDSIDPLSHLDTRAVQPVEGPRLTKPTAVSYKPPAPYTFDIPGEDDMYVKFERYGAPIPGNDGYLFMLRLESILNSVIRDRGKSARVSAHHEWAWEHCKLTLTMNRPPQIGELLTWITGLWKFMKQYEYVEADMQFERIWAPDMTPGTAKFEIGSEE